MGGTFKLQKILRLQPKVKKAPIVPVVNTDAEAKKRAEQDNQETIERQRRGQDGMIRTSYSGILGEKENTLKRKNLLGE